eukprot:4998635-Amphidinium_carterae.1
MTSFWKGERCAAEEKLPIAAHYGIAYLAEYQVRVHVQIANSKRHFGLNEQIATRSSITPPPAWSRPVMLGNRSALVLPTLTDMLCAVFSALVHVMRTRSWQWSDPTS